MDPNGPKATAGLRQSMHDLMQTQSSSTKNSQNLNRFVNLNQNTTETLH